MVQEYMFESFDGTELYGKTDSVADPRGVDASGGAENSHRNALSSGRDFGRSGRLDFYFGGFIDIT